MQVTLVGPAHPYKGGGARHTTELARRLSEEGHRVVLESWRAQYPALLYPGRQTVEQAEGEPFPATLRRMAWYGPDTWWAAGRRAAARGGLLAVAVLSPVQVPAYLVLLAAAGRRVRTAVVAHNVLPHEPRPGDRPLMRALLRRAGTVLVHSREQAALARRLAPGADVRVADLPPHFPDAPGGRGVGPAASSKGFPHYLFFGLVRPYKGVDVLIRAFAKGAPPSARLTVAGEFWTDADAYRALAADLGVADRVVLREGYVPAGEVPALLDAADVLVLPYRSATSTQNVRLAHERGLPVVATRAGAMAEQVRDGVDGLLCEPGDADDLARALAVFASPGKAEELRKGVRPADTEALWAAYTEELVRASRGS